MKTSPKSKREHLRRLAAGKQQWGEPLSSESSANGFRGWHERGYLPHCDKPGLVQFITFRLWDSMPASRKSEWEHLLAVTGRSIASRAQRIKLEEYIDRGLGECFLRDPRIATLMEKTMRFHHGSQFGLLAWVVMPNHVHALFKVGDTPLSKIIQNWKSIVAVKANKLLKRTGDFWQLDYWDTFMRDEEQKRKAIHYIENNPVKAKLCTAPEEWSFSSARFRNPQTRELELPPK
jgi:REP element-mobilizing transposase RayT